MPMKNPEKNQAGKRKTGRRKEEVGSPETRDRRLFTATGSWLRHCDRSLSRYFSGSIREK
jgi:hypothetical protein